MHCLFMSKLVATHCQNTSMRGSIQSHTRFQSRGLDEDGYLRMLILANAYANGGTP